MDTDSESTRIAIFGGGRWARVLLGVLMKCTPESTLLTVHTRHNLSLMRRWCKEKNASSRVYVTDVNPDFAALNYNAAVVVNDARRHLGVAKLALEHNVPVLIEKPMASSYEETLELLRLSKIHGTSLKPSFVFLYARYIDNFIKAIGDTQNIRELHFSWKDKAAESRYGESKSFDHSISVMKDVLPHVLSIIFKVLKRDDFALEKCKVSRGGALVELVILVANVKCFLELERNSSSRLRELSIIGSESLTLDFSKEPGTLCAHGLVISADSFWDLSPSPLERMVMVFLDEISAGENHPDSQHRLALSVSEIIDIIELEYLAKRDDWMIQQLMSGKTVASDVYYFLSEMVSSDMLVSRENSEERVSSYYNLVVSDNFRDSFQGRQSELSRDGIVKFIASQDA